MFGLLIIYTARVRFIEALSDLDTIEAGHVISVDGERGRGRGFYSAVKGLLSSLFDRAIT